MRTRTVGTAAVAAALVLGIGACGAPHHKAAAPPSTTRPTATRPATPSATVTVPSRVAAQSILDALTPQDDAHGFVLAGSSPDLIGLNSVSDVARGRQLTVEAACAGRGGVTVTAASGRAHQSMRLACDDGPQPGTLQLTTGGTQLSITTDADPGATGSGAYVVHTSSY